MAEEGAGPGRCGPLQFLVGYAAAVRGVACIDFQLEVTKQPDRERQLKRLAKRKQEHQTSNDVVAAGTALGLSYEEIEKLDKEGRKRKRRMGSLKVLPRKFGLPRRRR